MSFTCCGSMSIFGYTSAELESLQWGTLGKKAFSQSEQHIGFGIFFIEGIIRIVELSSSFVAHGDETFGGRVGS